MYLISFVLLQFLILNIIFTVPQGSQRICNIVSTSLPTLTTPSGEIANGTQNVILYCVCMVDGIAVGPTIWVFDGNGVATQANGTNPYYRNNVPGPLFIPLFIMDYNGMYRCESDGALVSSSDNSITLTAGMYMYI